MDEDVVSALKKFQKELSAGTVSLALLAVLGRSRQPIEVSWSGRAGGVRESERASFSCRAESRRGCAG